jgi:hypothetical protein
VAASFGGGTGRNRGDARRYGGREGGEGGEGRRARKRVREERRKNLLFTNFPSHSSYLLSSLKKM